MAQIIICEPSIAICELVAHVATVLGHELAFSDPAAGVPLPPADALILEPAAPGAIACAKAFRNAQPALPILCISSCSDAPGCDELAPVVYLVKPFELAELEDAIPCDPVERTSKTTAAQAAPPGRAPVPAATARRGPTRAAGGVIAGQRDLRLTERRRSRTYPAVGYTTSPVLKP